MDDNSLVKNLIKSVPVASQYAHLDGHRAGTGFVASHVWQITADGYRSARNPLTYSFVPNVLWLPTDVSRLSDRAGFAPAFLQALAHRIYREEPVHPSMKKTVDDAWSLLPNNESVPPQGLPVVEDLNYFVPSPAWLLRRIETIETIGTALLQTARGNPPTTRVFTKRYGPGLASLKRARARALSDHLIDQAKAAREALDDYPGSCPRR